MLQQYDRCRLIEYVFSTGREKCCQSLYNALRLSNLVMVDILNDIANERLARGLRHWTGHDFLLAAKKDIRRRKKRAKKRQKQRDRMD